MAAPRPEFDFLKEGPIKESRHDDTIMDDDLRHVTIANLIDNIQNAWKGWETAVGFEDDGLQKYYMKFITILNQCLEKIQKI